MLVAFFMTASAAKLTRGRWRVKALVARKLPLRVQAQPGSAASPQRQEVLGRTTLSWQPRQPVRCFCAAISAVRHRSFRSTGRLTSTVLELSYSQTPTTADAAGRIMNPLCGSIELG